MRWAFGLGGILVTLGVIVWIMAAPGGELDQTKAALDAQRKVTPQINQMGGRDAQGTPAADSASLQAQFDTAGKMKGLFVMDVVSGGAYDTHYGLKPNDLIIQIGPFDVRTLDEGMAQAQMSDAFSRNDSIVVLRNSEKVTLPLTAGATPAATASPGATPTAAPTPPKSKGLQGQLDSIQNSIPTH